jgi:hypothetical protein
VSEVSDGPIFREETTEAGEMGLLAAWQYSSAAAASMRTSIRRGAGAALVPARCDGAIVGVCPAPTSPGPFDGCAERHCVCRTPHDTRWEMCLYSAQGPRLRSVRARRRGSLGAPSRSDRRFPAATPQQRELLNEAFSNYTVRTFGTAACSPTRREGAANLRFRTAPSGTGLCGERVSGGRVPHVPARAGRGLP